MLRAICVFTIALFFSRSSIAIDKYFLDDLKPESAEKVLMSFRAPVFYLVTEKGANLVQAIKEKTPYVSHAYQHAILIFVEEKDARSYGQFLQKSAPERLGLKGSNLNRILVGIYRVKNEPPSSDGRKPDMVIVDTFQPAIPLIEMFVDQQQRPYVHELRGKAFIPAFMSREEAAAFETTVNAAGKGIYSRRGVDFRSHLKIVETYINTETPVVTFANRSLESMNLYAEEGK